MDSKLKHHLQVKEKKSFQIHKEVNRKLNKMVVLTDLMLAV